MSEENKQEAIESEVNEQVQEEPTSTPDDQTSEDQVEEVSEHVESTPEPEKPDPRQAEWDKQLQKMQQLTATLERQQSAGQTEAAQKTRDRIEELLASDDLDYNPSKGFKTLAEELREYKSTLNEMRQQVAQYEQSQIETQRKAFESEFKANNPELADQYDTLTTELRKDAEAYAQQGITGKALDEVLAARWELKIAQAKANRPAQPESVTKTPKATSPVKKPGQPKPPQGLGWDPQRLAAELRLRH